MLVRVQRLPCFLQSYRLRVSPIRANPSARRSDRISQWRLGKAWFPHAPRRSRATGCKSIPIKAKVGSSRSRHLFERAFTASCDGITSERRSARHSSLVVNLIGVRKSRLRADVCRPDLQASAEGFTSTGSRSKPEMLAASRCFSLPTRWRTSMGLCPPTKIAADRETPACRHGRACDRVRRSDAGSETLFSD